MPETVIANAASRGSISGRAYRIGCPGQPERAAGRWYSEPLRPSAPRQEAGYIGRMPNPGADA